MKHTIKKQVLLLEVDAGLDAFALQQAASSYYWGRIVPALERLFDQLSEEGEWVRLDKLEIDLGKIEEKVLQDRELDQELYRLLWDQLREALTGREKAALPKHEAAAGHALWQWWYYMEHGRLHWGQSTPTAEWYGRVLEMLSVDHASVSRLRETIRHQPLVLQRIVAQHTDEFLEKLAGILVAEALPGAGAWVGAIVRLARLMEEAGGGPDSGAGDDGSRSKARNKIDRSDKAAAIKQRWAQWRERHREILSAGEYRRAAVVWRYLLREASSGSSLFRQWNGGAKLLLHWLTDDDPVVLRYLRRRSPVLPKGMQWPSVKEGKTETKPLKEDITDENAVTKAGPAAGTEDDGKQVRDRRPDADVVDEDGIYIPNAGIILLHPFLATCFSRLHWWQEGRFVDRGAWEKAIFLLHYLATGQRGEVAEYALVFEKVLCGWPMEEPLPANAALQEGDYVEADNLLEMVLVRWDKLKGSSVDGLREGFLQRGGKLTKRGGGLGLLVEQQGIDILLDYLPWGIGTVKLPWMKEIIFVEWR